MKIGFSTEPEEARARWEEAKEQLLYQLHLYYWWVRSWFVR